MLVVHNGSGLICLEEGHPLSTYETSLTSLPKQGIETTSISGFDTCMANTRQCQGVLVKVTSIILNERKDYTTTMAVIGD
jgi:hypothetical protein